MAKIYAHRGYSGKFFENSSEAFKKCLDLDIFGIETDVQLTKDGVPVIIHDEYLKRLLNKDAFVKDLTLDELKSLKYENGESPITLDEYIEIFKDSKLVSNIELKTGVFLYQGIEQKVYDAFKKNDMLDRLLVSSFNHYSLLKMKEIDSEIPLGALTGSTLISPEKYLKQYGFQFYHPVFSSVNKKMLEDLHKNNIQVNAWTINYKEVYETSIEIGLDGVITNYPELDFPNLGY